MGHPERLVKSVVADFLKKNNGLTYRELAEKYDLTYDQAKGIVYRHVPEDRRRKALQAKKKKQLDFEAIRREQARKDELREYRKIARQAAREETAAKRVIEALREEVPAFDVPAVASLPTPSKDASEETILLDLADWHYGEIVDRERMRGWNEYNSVIASERVAQVVRTVSDIVLRLTSGGKWVFPDLVVVLGGDMVTGTIHELERHSDTTIVRTSLGCAWLIARAIRDLSLLFDTVRIVGVVGNHGRMSRKKQYKDPDRNWDWLIYQTVAMLLRENDKVDCRFPISHSLMVNIRDWNFFVTHGDEFRARLSMPYYSIQRNMSRIKALEASRGGEMHYSLIHHWHDGAETPLVGGKNIVMPSLKGADEYSLEKLGKAARPGQWMAGVNDKHGLTHKWTIWADELDDDLPDYYCEPWREAA